MSQLTVKPHIWFVTSLTIALLVIKYYFKSCIILRYVYYLAVHRLISDPFVIMVSTNWKKYLL